MFSNHFGGNVSRKKFRGGGLDFVGPGDQVIQLDNDLHLNNYVYRYLNMVMSCIYAIINGDPSDQNRA